MIRKINDSIIPRFVQKKKKKHFENTMLETYDQYIFFLTHQK